MALAWATIENALQAWLVSKTGLAAGKVLWAHQAGALQRPRPYATLEFTRIGTVSWDDGGTWSTDLSRVGQEVKQSSVSQKEMGLRINVYTAETQGASCAFAKASDAATSLLSESVRGDLRDAGLVVVDWADVTDLGQLLDTTFEGRAQLEIRLRTSDQVDDYFGYIATCTPTGTYVPNPDHP